MRAFACAVLLCLAAPTICKNNDAHNTMDDHNSKDQGQGKGRCCTSLVATCQACTSHQDVTTFCLAHPNYSGCGSGINTNDASTLTPTPTPAAAEPAVCCQALTARCAACAAGSAVDMFCESHPWFLGCSESARNMSQVATFTLTRATAAPTGVTSAPSVNNTASSAFGVPSNNTAARNASSTATGERAGTHETPATTTLAAAAESTAMPQSTRHHHTPRATVGQEAARGKGGGVSTSAAVAGGIGVAVVITALLVLGGFFMRQKNLRQRRNRSVQNYGTGPSAYERYERLITEDVAL